MNKRNKTDINAADRKVLRYVASYIKRNGHCPSGQTIGEAMGYTAGNARAKLRTLARFGYLKVRKGYRQRYEVVA